MVTRNSDGNSDREFATKFEDCKKTIHRKLTRLAPPNNSSGVVSRVSHDSASPAVFSQRSRHSRGSLRYDSVPRATAFAYSPDSETVVSPRRDGPTVNERPRDFQDLNQYPDLSVLDRRGKGNHRCPYGEQCNKGGFNSETRQVETFEQNSAFRYVYLSHGSSCWN